MLLSGHALAQGVDPDTLPEMVFWADKDTDRIYANGRITPDTVFKFIDFMKQPNLPKTLSLRSGGGSIVPAMKIAEEIRHYGLDTEADAVPSQPNSKVAQDGACYSACVYMFLAGTNRTVLRRGRIGLHRSSFPKNYRPDYDIEQQQIARELRYFRERGVSTELLEIAYETPNNTVRILNRDELVRFGVVTQPSPVSNANPH